MNLAEEINESTNLSKMGVTQATGYAQPMILPWKEVVKVKRMNGSVDQSSFNSDVALYQCPITFKLSNELSEDGFTLPVDPLIGVSGKNVIVRRYVSKSDRRGSVKERWSQDDYDITITGVIVAKDAKELGDYVSKLKKYCEAKEAIHVTSDFLYSIYGIDRIAIESYEFPFTKGIENQAFSIKAYSDDLYELLEEDTNV